ncbi:MAG: hypothetical protein CMJ31_00770 [Phycisphaerae bacterium]|nr:hypothetical protein [Phycisphaerae bacterium]
MRSRLKAAERFLGEQEKQLAGIGQQSASLDSQIRQLTATSGDAEGEIKALDEKIEGLRERMNTSNTSKEYKAILAEVNTLKERRSEHETRALEAIEKVDQLKSQRDELSNSKAERERVRGVAVEQRDQRADEIREKLAELEKQREEIAKEVPPRVLETYEELVARLEDEAVAPIEVQDRKRHEYNCGACMMSLPVETMSTLLGSGALTHCVSCGCILYLDETAKSLMLSASKR